MSTIISTFKNKSLADSAVTHLRNYGYSNNDISVIVKEGVVETTNDTRPVSAGEAVAEGAVSGATAGGILAGLAGLLVGLSGIAIPGLGAILIGGPLAASLGLSGAAATAVSAATTGAVAGGLVGAFEGLGVSAADAATYQETLASGGVILAVAADSSTAIDEVSRLMREAGATEVKVTD